MRRLKKCVLFFILFGMYGVYSAEVPVAPITPTSELGYDKAFRLENDHLELVIVPETGCLASLRFQGHDNLIKCAGGLFPYLQEDLPESTLGESRAWKNTDGTQNCLLIQEYGEPLHAKCTRLIKLYPKDSTIHIRQRIERLKLSDRPLCFRQVSQIVSPQNIFMQKTNASGIDDAKHCGKISLLDTTKTEGKNIFLENARWIATRQKDLLMLMQLDSESHSKHPQSFQIKLLPEHAEIEISGKDIDVSPGNYLENTVRISVQRIIKDSEVCSVTNIVNEMLINKNE